MVHILIRSIAVSLGISAVLMYSSFLPVARWVAQKSAVAAWLSSYDSIAGEWFRNISGFNNFCLVVYVLVCLAIGLYLGSFYPKCEAYALDVLRVVVKKAKSLFSKSRKLKTAFAASPVIASRQ